jgi:diguanylate cyclase (GGDEF)-like protein
MDPSTVVIVLAVHLISSGALLFLIGRQMPARGGIGHWATGAILFGTAYLARLVGGVFGHTWWLLMLDAAMVAAALMFLAGLVEFVGHGPVVARLLIAAVGSVTAVEVLATLQWGIDGRYTVLNVSLGLVYLAVAVRAAMAIGHQPAALAPPLRMVMGVVGMLGLLTTSRGVYIALNGSVVAYKGLMAQVYYGYASLAAATLAMTLLWMVFVRLNGQLAELAARDPLTRVLNRNGLDEAMVRHFAARPAQPLTLMQLDLDHFKHINDQHGHAAGDAMLQAAARSLEQGVRGSDFVARVGGEEFLVGFVGGSPEDARALGARLVAGVRDLPVPWGKAGQVLRCTASIGVSHPMNRLDETERAWQEADLALYLAKARGRNQLVAADEVDTPKA